MTLWGGGPGGPGGGRGYPKCHQTSHEGRQGLAIFIGILVISLVKLKASVTSHKGGGKGGGRGEGGE